ncbi:MAG: LCP family protein, partial [Lachnospiraceae bacterium]|nr:LCP family protein [Lachnospiraceae bacterium]
MSKISDSESEEIQRNLERFMDQQIREYRYTNGEVDAMDKKAASSYKSMEIDVPNINSPRRSTASTGMSFIDINREGFSDRSYDDDLDDDFDRDSYKKQRRSRPVKEPQYYEEDEEPEYDQPKEKKKKKHRLLKVIIILVILLAIGGVGGYFLWQHLIGSAYDKMTYKEAKEYSSTLLTENEVTNILLLGNDSRDNASDGRTDSIILLTINRAQKKIYLTSFLRDIKIDIPGKGINRLNQSYAFGGPELVMKTLSDSFDIKISRYMLVNFQAFAKLADAVGGVDLEVTAEEVDYINAYLWEYNDINGDDIHKDNFPDGTSGLLHLNGPQALAYCRNRYIGTDFERSNRQKKVITAIVKKLPQTMVTNFNGIMDGLFPSLTTSLTKDDCYEL